MKKVLFASTALFASAGIASAEMSLSGFAAMGIWGGDNIETQFVTDVDVTFTGSGSTDNGLTFGFSIDLDEGGNGQPFENTLTQGGETIFVSGAFGTLTMGDTDGALDWALTEAIIGGAIGDVHEHVGYSGNAGLDGSTSGTANDGVAGAGNGQIARYEYSFGDFAVAVSAEIETNPALATDNVYGVGLRYNAELGGVDLAFGLGYQSNNVNDALGASISASFDNGLQAILSYTDLDGFDAAGGIAGTQDENIGVAVGYTWDAVTVAVNYGQWDGAGSPDVEGFGLIVNYDLGGGAELQAGYAQSSVANVDTDRYSFGLSMSF